MAEAFAYGVHFLWTCPAIKALVRNPSAFTTLFTPGKSKDNVSTSVAPYTESRLAHLVRNKCIEQLLYKNITDERLLLFERKPGPGPSHTAHQTFNNETRCVPPHSSCFRRHASERNSEGLAISSNHRLLLILFHGTEFWVSLYSAEWFCAANLTVACSTC